VGAVQSDSENLQRRVDCWRLSSGGGGAIPADGFREFGCRGHAITVTVWLQCCGSGKVVVWNDLSEHAWRSSE
jgi:hypothetical protein